jgi:hypothetical protein
VVCVPPTGACTINAGCCNGSFCSVLPGSVAGTCNPIPNGGGGTPDSGTVGDSGTTTEGGSPEGGSPDSGTTDDSGGGGGGGGGTCSLYGQACTTAGNCCNAVPCTAPDGVSVCSTATGCTCVFANPR